MPLLLLEIGCEELPAGSVYEAEAQLPSLSERQLGVAPDAILVGPRRLALLATVEEPTGDEWVKGPPVSLREQAAAGFAKRHGVAPEELEERDGFLGVVKPAQPLAETLSGALDGILQGLAFGKTMRWDDSGLRFPRPVRWTCARLDGDPVEGHGTTTFGHRFTKGQVEVRSAGAYAETLRAADVEPDAAVRERLIREGLDALGDWRDPLRKLPEVIHLVEKPVVLDGRFDERFLALPGRVIETAMQSHQRYFPLGGNRFAFVANGGDPDVVRAGNENVLEGRLDDASFTFERDLEAGIDELASRLGSIVYFAEAGTFADKSGRLVRLVEQLGGGDASLEAARLAKADQASELVREFPDLEGSIGAEYARAAGYPEAVSAAVAEQYLPDSAGGPLPETEPGRVLAAADKIDTLGVSFALGHRPTGSRDPYGLRRAAIGLCRLATEGGLTVPRELLPEEVAEFVEERFEGLLRDVPVEYVRAARAASVPDLGSVARLAQSLAALPDERFEPIHTAYIRASRLGEKEEAAVRLDPGLFSEPTEREVADALAEVEPQIADALQTGDFDAAVEAGARLGPVLHRFFEDVLVMAEDATVRENRLRLLLDVRDTLGALGDLAQIPRGAG
ncbi:MAG TPA: glycine--tRNA ligase subunit beta [Gaiellaceae bacterium]|nr:glycine--tRNA ligase subunit beta [Gaiellaceae bacterium]